MNFKQVIDKISGRKKYRNALEELMDDEPFFRLVYAITAIILIVLLLCGCGDYYVNVDKDSVKIEADVEGLIDGND